MSNDSKFQALRCGTCKAALTGTMLDAVEEILFGYDSTPTPHQTPRCFAHGVSERNKLNIVHSLASFFCWSRLRH